MKNNTPLVSICIPTYNGERYLKEALNSAISQSYKNIEIIISDDSSTDKTLEIIKDFKKSSKFPVFIFNHKPTGLGANWNNCVINAKGGYIKFLFQDDVLENNCIEKMMEVALKDETIGLVFSKRNFISENNNSYHNSWIKKFDNIHLKWTGLKEINSGKKLLKKCKLFLHTPMNKVGEPTAVLINKKVFTKIGYFNENLIQVLDFEFWYRIFKYYKIGFVNERLVKFRLHEGQATNLKNDKQSDYILYEKIIFKNLFFQLHFKIQLKLLLKNVILFPILKTINANSK